MARWARGARMLPAQLQPPKYNGRAVQLDVTEKYGKVVLRPVVK